MDHEKALYLVRKIIKSVVCLSCAAFLGVLILYIGTDGFGSFSKYDNAIDQIFDNPAYRMTWKEYAREQSISTTERLKVKELENEKLLEQKITSLAKTQKIHSNYHKIVNLDMNSIIRDINALRVPFLFEWKHGTLLKHQKKAANFLTFHYEVQAKKIRIYFSFLEFMKENFGRYKLNVSEEIVFTDEMLQRRYLDYQETLSDLEVQGEKAKQAILDLKTKKQK